MIHLFPSKVPHPIIKMTRDPKDFVTALKIIGVDEDNAKDMDYIESRYQKSRAELEKKKDKAFESFKNLLMN